MRRLANLMMLAMLVFQLVIGPSQAGAMHGGAPHVGAMHAATMHAATMHAATMQAAAVPAGSAGGAHADAAASRHCATHLSSHSAHSGKHMPGGGHDCCRSSSACQCHVAGSV